MKRRSLRRSKDGKLGDSLPRPSKTAIRTRPTAPTKPMTLSKPYSLSSSPHDSSHSPGVTLSHSTTTSDPSKLQPLPADSLNLNKPKNTRNMVSQPEGKSSPPEKVIREQSTDLVDATGNPNPDGKAAADPTPFQVAGPERNQNGTPFESRDQPRRPLTENPSTQSTHSSPEPDIESLYASPSTGNTATELVPIELDSDPDFETMERRLSSHRGPLSQSQPIKKESIAESLVPSRARRSLKRQRSYPFPDSSFQATTQNPQVNSKPAKRPRVNGPHSSGSTVVLNDRRKHPEFWDLDGTVILQVDGVLFRVMRSTLGKASPWFQRLFSEGLDHLEIMAGCPVYIIEEDFSHLDFANLLRGLENGL